MFPPDSRIFFILHIIQFSIHYACDEIITLQVRYKFEHKNKTKSYSKITTLQVQLRVPSNTNSVKANILRITLGKKISNIHTPYTMTPEQYRNKA